MSAAIIPMRPRPGAVRQKLHRLTVLGLIDAWEQDPHGAVRLRTAGGDQIILSPDHVWPYLEGVAHGAVLPPPSPDTRRQTFRPSLTSEHAAGRRPL